MPQAFEHCYNAQPRQAESLSSMCWPITRQVHPLTVLDRAAMTQQPYQPDVKWPLAEPWRRNLQQPGCESQGLCQGDARRCNSKYRHGVDDVGQCPSHSSCKSSFSCPPCEQECANPCEDAISCNRRTSRCFEWPQPRRNLCPKEDTNEDFKPRRANLNVEDNQPERCPTCKRVVVDMQCGPLGYNY